MRPSAFIEGRTRDDGKLGTPNVVMVDVGEYVPIAKISFRIPDGEGEHSEIPWLRSHLQRLLVASNMEEAIAKGDIEFQPREGGDDAPTYDIADLLTAIHAAVGADHGISAHDRSQYPVSAFRAQGERFDS